MSDSRLRGGWVRFGGMSGATRHVGHGRGWEEQLSALTRPEPHKAGDAAVAWVDRSAARAPHGPGICKQ